MNARKVEHQARTHTHTHTAGDLATPPFIKLGGGAYTDKPISQRKTSLKILDIPRAGQEI